MITSEMGWGTYNMLANHLREAISTLGKKLLPAMYTCLEFKDKNLYLDNTIDPRFPEDVVIIKGICHNEEGIEIKIKRKFFGEEEKSLINTDISLVDFLTILENLEKYEQENI